MSDIIHGRVLARLGACKGCDAFGSNGFCADIKKFIPTIARKEDGKCPRGRWQGLKIVPIKPKSVTPPTVPQMAAHFAMAMAKWKEKGFKTVNKEEYFKRRLACAKCQPTGRCPHCGCNLWLKSALVTEECKEGLWPEIEIKCPKEKW